MFSITNIKKYSFNKQFDNQLMENTELIKMKY